MAENSRVTHKKSFFKRTVSFFKTPFSKTDNRPIEKFLTTEEESSSGDDSVCESCTSSCGSNCGQVNLKEKLKTRQIIAPVRSGNSRYNLRSNPKPSLSTVKSDTTKQTSGKKGKSFVNKTDSEPSAPPPFNHHSGADLFNGIPIPASRKNSEMSNTSTSDDDEYVSVTSSDDDYRSVSDEEDTKSDIPTRKIDHNVRLIEDLVERAFQYRNKNDCSQNAAIEAILREERKKEKRAGKKGKPTDLYNLMTYKHVDDHKPSAELISLLGNQQQNQVMTLLQGIEPFSGESAMKGTNAPRFEMWIRIFDSLLGMADFEDSKKIKLLSSKLTNLAAEALDDFIRSKVKYEISYKAAKEHLMNRFHGAETREMYEREYRSCIREAGETVLDYAHRLKRLFQHAYPLTEEQRAIPDVLTVRDQLLRDRFIAGLPIKLREKVKFKSFNSYDDLVKSATKYDVSIQEMDDEKKKVEIIARIAGLQQEETTKDSEITTAIKQIKDEILQLKEFNKPKTGRNIERNKYVKIEENPSNPWPQTPQSYVPQFGQQMYPQPTYSSTFKPEMQIPPTPPNQYRPPNFYQPRTPTVEQKFNQFNPQNQFFRAPNWQQNNQSTRQPIICHRCNKPNHISRNCRTVLAANGEPLYCESCGKPNHEAKDCRSRPMNYSATTQSGN